MTTTQPHTPRLAVVGSSHWHHKFYKTSIAHKSELVAYSDPSEAKRDEVSDLYGDTGHADWRDLLDESLDLDGVVVLGPHDEMTEVALAFIERGIPVVLEKPGGLDAEQVGRVRAASEAAGVPVTPLFIQRVGNLRESLQQVGDLDYVTFVFHSGPPERYVNQSPWALEHKHAGGGCFINLAVHYIDLFLESTRATRLTVQAQSQARFSQPYDVEDRMTALVTTPDGISATIEVGYAFPTSPTTRYLSYSARGSKGFAELDGQSTITFTQADGTTSRRTDNVDSGPLTTLFIDAAIDSVLTGFEGLPTVADLHRTMQVVDAAYRSAREGTAVTVDIAW